MSLDIDRLAHKLTVKEKTLETQDAVSLSLEIPENLKKVFKYEAGQFITFFLSINGKDIRRSYSLSSSPDADPDFTITVKRVKGGVVSNYLIDEVNVGDVLNVTPPAGHFCLPDYVEGRTLVFYAAGSGITPVISLIKSALKTSPNTHCYLLYANRNEDSIIFHRNLLKLSADFPERFKLEYFLSSPNKVWSGKTGRISSTYIEEFLNTHKIPKEALHYMCGPETFMSTVQATLELHGFAKSSIIKESFVSPAQVNPPSSTTAKDAPSEAGANTATQNADGENAADATDDATYIGDRKNISTCSEIEVILDGETKTVPYLKGTSILESLLDAGLNPPYSCMDGACMACIAKINEGCAFQEDLGILTEDNIEARECLTCQARPATKKIKVNYDSL